MTKQHPNPIFVLFNDLEIRERFRFITVGSGSHPFNLYDPNSTAEVFVVVDEEIRGNPCCYRDDEGNVFCAQAFDAVERVEEEEDLK